MRVTAREPKESARDYATRMLKANIISLELAPGSQVSENELAVQLGISRTPVREALIDLAKVKIVEVMPQRGSIIAPIDYDLVDEARFMRETLEVAAVKRCCEHPLTPEMQAALRENLALQEYYRAAAATQDGRDHMLELDNAFHALLFQAANVPMAYILLSGLTVHFDRVRSMALDAKNGNVTVESHEELYRAILAGDAEKAEALMHEHLSRYTVDKIEVKKKYPQYFR